MLFAAMSTIIGPTILAVVVAVVLGRRKFVAAGDSDSDSVSFAGGILSAMFTVVLAFYVVFAWQAGSDISNTADTEADALIDAYWQADLAAEPNRAILQGMLRDYATAVADREWDALAAGRADGRGDELVRGLRAGFVAMPAPDDLGQVARAQALRDVRQIDESHRARVGLAAGTDFNGVLLIGTVVGALLVVVFPLLAGLSATPLNMAVLGLMVLTVGAAVFLSLQLANPLGGPFGVGPDAFKAALQHMQPAIAPD